MKPITEKQVRLIRFLASQLGWSEDVYKEFLWEFFKAKSAKELSIKQAATAIDIMNEHRVVHTQEATPGQVKYIVDHWKRIDKDAMQYGDKNLHAFLERKFDVTSVYDLTKKQASGAIAAIRAMEKKSCELALKRKFDREEQREMSPATQARVTIDGRAVVDVLMPDGKMLKFQLSMEDHGRLN